jgi:methylenetetrahydrofolate dehydrogenase (NADP+)/methenyltetrahydrofolate cyclohydrolase
MIILDGKKTKLEILEKLKKDIYKLNTSLGLAVIQIGEDPASNVYVKNKAKMASDLGYKFKHIHLDENVSEEEVLKEIDKLNNDDSIDGILVQMPIPSHLNSKRIQNAIDSLKDVDGLTDINMGKLSHGVDSLVPCTPMGIIDLLKTYNISIEGKCVVIVGRSDLVGKPLASLMTNNNATVILCHSKTNNLSEFTKLADILVVAVGMPKMITVDMIKEGATIIDVGINRVEDGLVGDVDFEIVKDKAEYITPVPGGVGQMTVAELGVNTYKAHMLRNNL